MGTSGVPAGTGSGGVPRWEHDYVPPAREHDFVAIGLGPFNLGLACLTAPLDDLDGVFLEAREEFSWHPGMMLEGATIQVPFLADLVTMADPTSPWSFLSYLKQTGRLYPFYIRESFYPLRAEYDAYCRWASTRVPGTRFGRTVERVTHADGLYRVRSRLADGSTETHTAPRLVLGTGTSPVLPSALDGVDGPHVHSAGYLPARDRLRAGSSVTVLGSGQSAAEIYLDLLEGAREHGYRVDWITRSPRFFPMEYTKLTLEMTSPEYTSYFHRLPAGTRDQLLREQRSLYKGISSDLVDTIYDTLYRLSVSGPVPTRLLTGTALTDASWDAASGRYTLDLHHLETDRGLRTTTEGLVVATGYASRVPSFLEPVADRIRLDGRGRFEVGRHYAVDHQQREVFVQNAEEHTHGLSAPDLGMGALRNSVIIAEMLGREVYPVEQRIAFQEFGVPDDLARDVRPAPTRAEVLR
ncbi:lysine N(6)-hydroxylase/L-ornithine N(5)-oxygenase family protein [Auraticoccus monumenti]|uniref:L-lysine N6-monooxygenase MbtG n=1 Tax=Auraticoccus monumenti TaxID=675864 RepID=A0A1G6X8M6_9ACTN|nr:SidA/IucD/PvdA family monooxygenase [Auraticoccus monumenti]SDD74454.1 lysine N6-hydroxylase [Auraticoccus monumenti]